MGFNLFGSSNKSKSSTINHNSTGNSAIDGDNNGISVGNNTGTMTLTDHGAIDAARDGFATAGDAFVESAKVASQSLDGQAELARDSMNAVLAAHTASVRVLGDNVQRANVTAQNALGVAQDAKSRELTGDSVDVLGAARWVAGGLVGLGLVWGGVRLCS